MSLRSRAFWLCSILCACVLGAAVPAQAAIRYTVSVAEPDQHLFHVTMVVPGVKDELIVQLPAWNALYQIRDFAQRVHNVRGRDAAGVTLVVRKLDKQTWQVPGRGDVTLEYAVFWDEPGPFNSQLNRSHAFINLAMILFYVPNRRAEESRVRFTGLAPGWKIAVELRSGNDPSTFVAAGYDALVDAPVEIGEFEEFRFNVRGAPRKCAVRVVVHGDGWTSNELEETLRKIVASETSTMRDVPFDEYLFLYHFGAAAGNAGGGMEHSQSTAIFMASGASAAGVSAHEFFHLWNVKRIRPRTLEPPDYARENWTRALWFAEGVTSTYGAYALVRSGIWERRRFYDDLGAQITELQSRPARLWQSAEQASLDAWFEKSALYRGADYSISYYNKGQLLGVLLDILIRDASNNRAALDDVMRDLNERFARRGQFYDETSDLRAAAERAAGKSFEEFFARYVSGTAELPYGEVLALAGLRLKPLGEARADFGFAVSRGPDGMLVATQLEPGSAAEKAGLREGDVLLEINGAAFPRFASRWLRDHLPGETVRAHLRRNGSDHEVNFALSHRQETTYRVEEIENPAEKQRRIREGMLSGKVD